MTSLVPRATTRRSAAAGAALFGLLMAGCGPVVVEFPFPEVDDDDTVSDDDDDDISIAEPPSLEIIEVFSAESPFAGVLEVRFAVSDPDSASVTVAVQYSTDPELEAFADATLANDSAVGSSITIEGAAPMNAVPGAAEWDSATDIPLSTLTGAVQLCPTDAEGNEGACVSWGDLVVVNQATGWPGGFCAPGDVEGTDWIGGQSLIPLSDGECLNHEANDPPQPTDFAARFLVVLTNPHPGTVGFTISPSSALSDLGGPPPPPPLASGGPRAGRALSGLPPRLPAPGGAEECLSDLSEADLQGDPRTFLMRETIEDGAGRITVGATLQALGEHVAVYVDDETPLDFDADCADPSNPVDPDASPAFGFDNCDIEAVVDVFDVNVFPTVTGAFASPSDVDSSCRVTVLLSHRVNSLTLTDGDPLNDGFAVKAFAEPAIDLTASSLTLNPGSNEQEIIFVHAPDPAGLWSDEAVPLEGYLDYQLAGQMAVALQDLVSYAAHLDVSTLLVPGAPTAEPEADWLNDALGLVAADLAGFGSIAYPDAWTYLDRPHLQPLLEANTLADFRDRGGQYLFARYLIDLYGPEVLAQIVGADTVGIESIEAVTGAPFEDFALQWATALAASGRTNFAGGQLVADSAIPNFTTSSTVVVPPAPGPGDHLGADGFQQGFNLRGLNHTWTGGGPGETPAEVAWRRVMAENLDPLVFHPQSDFFGEVAGGYGVVAVLVAGLEQPVNHLLIETETGEDLLAMVFRLNDESPWAPSLTLEDISGAKITTARALGELPVDGTERRVIGRVDPDELIDVALSPDPATPGGPLVLDQAPIADTDRYSFELSAVTTLGVTVERRYSGLSGGVNLADPFVAVVLASDLPNAWNYAEWDFGPTPSDGVCSDAAVFNYPYVVPDFVAAQGNLIADPTVDWGFLPILDWEPTADAPPLPMSCSLDGDQDEVPDFFEAFPTTLHGQIVQRQAQNLAADPDFYMEPWSLMPGFETTDLSEPFFDASFIDVDSNEVPDDDFATAFWGWNLGGRAALGGEEAVWFGTLPPGEYVLVVGDASGSTGPYDLSVRRITP